MTAKEQYAIWVPDFLRFSRGGWLATHRGWGVYTNIRCRRIFGSRKEAKRAQARVIVMGYPSAQIARVS